MQNRLSYTLAAAALVGLAAAGQAQQRIPVTKDKTPEPRTDTVTVYRTDTVTVTRRDTVTVTQQVSTGVIATETPIVKLPPAFYFQLGGGVNFPQSRLNDFFDNGYNVTASVGWQPVTSVLGFRLDGTWDQLRGQEFNNDRVNSNVWSGLAEATLNVPIGNRMNGSGFYVIGGGGIHHFTGLDQFSTVTTTNNNGSTVTIFNGNNESSSTDWGINGGAGLRFGWGRAALFAESRYFHVYTEGDRSQWVPLIAGFTFR